MNAASPTEAVSLSPLGARVGARAIAFLLLLAQPSFAQAPGPVRPFALFVGQNEGGAGTKALRHAREDARRLHDLFLRLGGVKPEDAMLLLDESADDLTTALGELERRIRDAKAKGDRTTLLFFYSGHARDGALRLGTTKLALEAVKVRLANGPADMRVAFFDTCRSGAEPPTSGVRSAPAFEVETDATRQTKGLVILTASSADEASQESDLIGASYFSYFLATGLLGSADSDGDGRISLAEALTWATERTAAGASGPPLARLDLSGHGDLVLSDLADRHEGMLFPASAPPGPYFIIDPRGVVVAEASKGPGEQLIALGPGRYTVKRRLADHLRLGEVEIAAGEISAVNEAGFKNAKFSDDPVRGTGVTSAASRHWSLAVSGQYQLLFDRPTTSGGFFPSAPLLGAEATLHNVFARGFALSIDGGYGWTSGVVSAPLVGDLPYDFTLLTFGAALFYEWFQDERWIPFAGVHLSFNIMSREFADAALATQSYSTFTPGIEAGLKVRLTRSLSVIARARVHYLFYDVDETRHLGSADFGALLDYEF